MMSEDAGPPPTLMLVVMLLELLSLARMLAGVQDRRRVIY
jgi:hypothetical protein